jgi:hypothetical protein
VDANACQPASVVTYQPGPYRPANGLTQGVCSANAATAFYNACLVSGADMTECSAFEQANAACVACVLTPDTAKKYGPLIDHGGFVTANIAGCLELTDPTMLSCAKAVQALSGCELAACEANCAVHDSTSLAGYDACVGQAVTGGCRSLGSSAACALTAPDADPKTAPCLADFQTFYEAVVPLFCGPAASDAGDAAMVPSGFDATVDASED